MTIFNCNLLSFHYVKHSFRNISMRHILYFLTLLVILSACKKDRPTPVEPIPIEDTITYPVKLAGGIYRPISRPQLFTKNGEITNLGLIEKYAKLGTTDWFLTDLTVTFPWRDTVKYISKDTVILPFPRLWDKRIVKKVGDYTYLYMLDTVVGGGKESKSGEISEIVNKIGVHKPYYRAACTAWVTDCGYIQTYLAAVVTGNANQLTFPYLSIRITRQRANLRQGYLGGVNNVFEKEVLKLLQDGDTLLIQRHQVVYTRIK